MKRKGEKMNPDQGWSGNVESTQGIPALKKQKLRNFINYS